MSRAPERGDPEPKGFVAALRALLARLIPGRAARTAEFNAAARIAYLASVKLEARAPLAPAVPTPRVTGAPPTAPPLVRVAGTTEAATPSIEPGFDARPQLSEAAAQARPPEPSVAPLVEPRDTPRAPHRRRQPGETAPDFLLRTPTGVAPIADDFFDSLVRRVEGDR